MEISSQDAFEICFYENVARRDRANVAALELLGGLYSKHAMSKQALRIDRRLARLKPEDSRIRYNFACSLAVMGRKRDAVRELGIAIELGYDDWGWLQQDPDLFALKGFPDFESLVRRALPY